MLKEQSFYIHKKMKQDNFQDDRHAGIFSKMSFRSVGLDLLESIPEKELKKYLPKERICTASNQWQDSV